jgi:hypothetical protein
LEVLNHLRRTLGVYNFRAQYQQAPSPLGGGMVKLKWFKRYVPGQEPAKFDMVVQSWDTANKSTELKYVVNKLHRAYWVDTELYSTAQIQQYDTTYAPYQAIVTGYWGAPNITSWAQGMCSNWNTALKPDRLGV